MNIKIETSPSNSCDELRLVWAKMKYCCYWPARVVETPPTMGRTPARKICVLFFGSKTYGFVDLDKIEDYVQFRDKNTKKGRGNAFKKAIEDIDNFISDPITFRSNAYSKPINNKIKIKTEEYVVRGIKDETGPEKEELERDPVPALKAKSAQKRLKINTKTLNGPLEGGSSDLAAKICYLSEEKNKLIAELVSVKSEFQHCFFDLQKKSEALKSLTEQKDKMENFLNERIAVLSTELNAVNSKIPILKIEFEKQLNEHKISMSKLSRENKMLYARMEQLQYGISQGTDENKNTANSTVPKKTSQHKEDSIYEVEALLDHKLKRKQLQFLVRWKGFDSSHDSWEPERNLNCPKIQQEYIKSNYKGGKKF